MIFTAYRNSSRVIMYFSWVLFNCFYAEFWATLSIVTLSCLGRIDKEQSMLSPGIASGFAMMGMRNVFLWRGYANPCVAMAHYRLGYLSLRNCALNVAGELLGSIAGLGLVKLVTEDEAFNAGDGVCMAQAKDELKWHQLVLYEFVLASLILFGCAASWDMRIHTHRNSVSLHMVCLMTVASLVGHYYLGEGTNLGIVLAASIYQDKYEQLPLYFAGQLLAVAVIPWIWLNLLTVRHHEVMPQIQWASESEFSPIGVSPRHL